MTRRQFLQVAGTSVALAAAALSFPGTGRGDEGEGVVRVVDGPIPRSFKASKAAFCQAASFPTAPDAFRVLASRGITVDIYMDL